MVKTTVTPLAGLTLAPASTLLRDHVRRPERRSDHYLERYDRTTLFYDCVRLPERGSVLFTTPRMLNLWRPFRDSLRIGGVRPSRVKRRKWLRCEQIEAFAPEGAVTVTLGGQSFSITPRDTVAARFAGCNALVAVNKNNALHWIADWARCYVQAHGADAVVLFDNGSTDYTPQDIADTLAGIDGLTQAAVFSAPFPYGPTDSAKPLEISARFFQTGMLNIARRDALAHARAVLSVDIDEIARSQSGTSVFDKAMGHPLGMVTLQGSWVYPAPDSVMPADHRAHVYRRVPDRRCNQKWCLRPDGLMSRLGWAVHQIGGIFQNVLTDQSDIGLLHCHGTSTGWKTKRRSLPETLERDRDLDDFMAAQFPPRED